jgi:hypothetical protein
MSSIIRCPRCVFDEHGHSAPIGKVINPSASKKEYQDCPVCNGRGYRERDDKEIHPLISLRMYIASHPDDPWLQAWSNKHNKED